MNEGAGGEEGHCIRLRRKKKPHSVNSSTEICLFKLKLRQLVALTEQDSYRNIQQAVLQRGLRVF